jgi:hypothetical protein
MSASGRRTSVLEPLRPARNGLYQPDGGGKLTTRNSPLPLRVASPNPEFPNGQDRLSRVP